MREQSSDIDRELEELQKRLEPEGRFFPRNKLIPLTEAVVVADKIASRLKVTGYKTEELLRRALRAEDLTITVQGFAPGKTGEDWVRSLPAEESNILQQEEMTSESAIEELFNRRVQRRHRSDRDRKRRKAKSLIKNLAKSTGKERKTNRKKRKGVS